MFQNDKDSKTSNDSNESFKYVIEFINLEKTIIKSYQKAMNYINSHVINDKLFIYFKNHQNALNFWIKQYRKTGDYFKHDANLNEKLSSSLIKTSNLSGIKSTLALLKYGEERILADYLKQVSVVNVNQQSFIKNIVQPNQLLHINNIKSIINSI